MQELICWGVICFITSSEFDNFDTSSVVIVYTSSVLTVYTSSVLTVYTSSVLTVYTSSVLTVYTSSVLYGFPSLLGERKNSVFLFYIVNPKFVNRWVFCFVFFVNNFNPEFMIKQQNEGTSFYVCAMEMQTD